MAPSPLARPERSGWDLKPAVSAGLLILLTAFAYFPALRGGFLWDDDAHVTRPELTSLHGLGRIWFEVGATQQYYPVLHSAFWIEHRLWGDAVLGYHLMNVGLHCAAAWLLILILRRLAFPSPWLAGLLFALHPICVESVAWISEQKNTLSAVFYLASALVYLRFDENRRSRSYFCALALFGTALLTKTVTASLPAALLLIFWWRRGKLDAKRDVAPLVPWLVLAAIAGLFTALVEQKLIGAEGTDFTLALGQRVLLAGRVLAFYLGKLLWPAPLIFIYPRWTIDPHSAANVAPILGVAGLLAGLIFLARKNRGPLAGLLFFAGTLFPVLGFVNVYPFLFSYVADHFLYLASLGFLVPVAWSLAWAAERVPLKSAVRKAALFAVPVLLSVLAWHQSALYRDADTLNRATLSRNPDAWLAHYNLAVSLGNAGHLPEAIASYQATLRLKPDHWAAHNNLGSALLKTQGGTSGAIAEFETALRLKPDFAEAHNNLGIALGRNPDRLPEAVAHLRMALSLRPDYTAAHYNLGGLLLRMPGHLPEANAEFEAALKREPSNPEYHYSHADALSQAGQTADAIAEYRRAIQLKPDYMEAHSNLGATLARQPGHLAEAISEYKVAARLAPGNPSVHVNLGNALSKAPGRTQDALHEYEAALKIDPTDAVTHNSLGVVLSDVPGRFGDAVSEFETAVRLQPDFALAHYCLGVVLLKVPGRRDESARQFEKVLELRPDFEPAKRMLARLNKS